ncbi:nuclear transport factor 2 family protein [Phytoactinopolyspora limicola]|uniref:nuclear transport factor 2 family protein n=1 Tax=Phytoactinopolyspora limicola TaxID=2715536 RepID=UPI001A9C9BFC|nr:nuclear transport factor 2 family protein [Phytoactinopolyspora limicola]
MTDNNPSPALAIALAYHRAWTSRDLDAAMTYVADDVFWRVPDGDLKGKDAYRGYLENFLNVFSGVADVAAFGDDEHAVLFYYPQTPTTSTAPAGEHFTIRDGLIVENLLAFDRLSYAPPAEQ